MLAHFLNKTEFQESTTIKILASGIIFLAIIVRLFGLGNESAWIDEAYSINLSSHSIQQIIQGTAADQHPPLYYLLLHFWLMIGQGVSHARLLSALFGILLVAQTIIFGSRIFSAQVGIGSGLLMAISPLAVWYSQEARQYMLLALLTTISSYELWQSLNGRPRWIFYWLFSSLALYTQYFAIFIFLAHAIITFILANHHKNKRLILNWLISIVGVGLAFLPWLSNAINQFLYHTMPWISDPQVSQIRDVIPGLVFGNGFHILPEILKIILFVSLLGIVGWSAYQAKFFSSEFRRGYLFLSLWTFVPVVIISVISVIYPVFQQKQFLIILAPTLLLIVLITFMIKSSWGRILFLGIIIINSLSLVYQQVTLSKDDWRGVAAYIDNNIKPGDLVYANPAASSLALDLYWDRSIPFKGYPTDYDILSGGWEGEQITPAIVSEEFTLINKEYNRVWLVEFFPEFWDSNLQIETWLKGHASQESEITFGKIHLRLFGFNP